MEMVAGFVVGFAMGTVLYLALRHIVHCFRKKE